MKPWYFGLNNLSQEERVARVEAAKEAVLALRKAYIDGMDALVGHLDPGNYYRDIPRILAALDAMKEGGSPPKMGDFFGAFKDVPFDDAVWRTGDGVMTDCTGKRYGREDEADGHSRARW